MNDKETVVDTHHYIRLILPLMSKHNIPVTPRNFAVWYKYITGSDEELRLAIDTMLENKEEFSEEKKEALYRRFCSEKNEHELRKLHEDVRQILLTILGEVVELTGQTEDYELFVSKSVNILSEDASIEEFKSVVNEIIEKTKKFSRLRQVTLNKLKETTRELEALKKDLELVKNESLMDFLTGIPNRRAFDYSITSLANEVKHDGGNLSLLLIDIDHFKKFNDEYGHLLGDEVLKFVAKKIKEMVKGSDFVARFGGEEFAVLLPRTALTGAHVVAEKIRIFFSETKLKAIATSRNLGTISVSIGASCYRPGELAETFIRRSDEALYHAKETGRNKVVTEQESSIRE